MWNGYGLKKIFHIDAPNISMCFAPDAWDRIVQRVRESLFWKDGWNYSGAMIAAFEAEGLTLSPCCKEGSEANKRSAIVQRVIRKLNRETQLHGFKKYRYPYKNMDPSKNYYCGHSFPLLKTNNEFRCFRNEILDLFQFPAIEDGNNKTVLEKIHQSNSVGMHIRRGDLLAYNNSYYVNGYFKRAVQYMKKHLDCPSFYLFADSGSWEWCESHLEDLGLGEKDEIHFVNWNQGDTSFRDMQLMAECKHCIITNSSFGWWSCYLNKNPKKITCSPIRTWDTSIHV